MKIVCRSADKSAYDHNTDCKYCIITCLYVIWCSLFSYFNFTIDRTFSMISHVYHTRGESRQYDFACLPYTWGESPVWFRVFTIHEGRIASMISRVYHTRGENRQAFVLLPQLRIYENAFMKWDLQQLLSVISHLVYNTCIIANMCRTHLDKRNVSLQHNLLHFVQKYHS